MVFVGLEKAYARVPREFIWWCMRKKGVPDRYVTITQDIHNGCETLVAVAYPELVLRGVSKSHTFKWLVKVGASKDVIRVDLNKIMAGGSGQPKKPGYATEYTLEIGHMDTEYLYVRVGLHQWSALSPLLFILLMGVLQANIGKEPQWVMLFADDLVICEDSRAEVELPLERWRDTFESHGLRVSRGENGYKTVMVYGAECWAVRKEEESKLPTTEMRMLL